MALRRLSYSSVSSEMSTATVLVAPAFCDVAVVPAALVVVLATVAMSGFGAPSRSVAFWMSRLFAEQQLL
ncbi:MAG: hypothetical protein AAF698_03720 [Pseudomonadota bacterium]